MRADKILIIQKSISRPSGLEVVRIADRPERFIPLGSGYVRDIADCGQYPVELCTIKCVSRKENIYSATTNETDTEVWFQVGRAYERHLADTSRARGIVLTYQKEMETISYLTPVVQAIQISFDPIAYAECVPMEAP